MANSDPARWQQRFSRFSKAMSALEGACLQRTYSDLERAGLIKTFEVAFELGWKTLKDLHYYEGLDDRTPREVRRRALATGYLDAQGAEAALDALDKRNLLSHTYNEPVAQAAIGFIKDSYAPALRALLQRLHQRRSIS